MRSQRGVEPGKHLIDHVALGEWEDQAVGVPMPFGVHRRQQVSGYMRTNGSEQPDVLSADDASTGEISPDRDGP